MPRPKKDTKKLIKFPKNKMNKGKPDIPVLNDDTPEDKWANGDLHQFKNGDVVEQSDGSLGVIKAFIPEKYKRYSIRWHTGKPNKWDSVWGEAHEDFIKPSKKANPIDIPSWEKYPGPSSDMIRELHTALKNKTEERNVEEYIQTLEQDLKRKKLIKDKPTIEEKEEEVEVEVDDDDDIDSVIDYTLEDEKDEIVTSDEVYRMIKEDLEDII